MDITEFLTARYDEEQAAINAIEDHSEPWRGEWVIKAGTLYTHNGWCLAALTQNEVLNGKWRPGVLEHIVRHDPARVLADLAAKRRIVKAYEGATKRRAEHRRDGYHAYDAQRVAGAEEALTVAVLALAMPYAGHPDFNEAWRIDD